MTQPPDMSPSDVAAMDAAFEAGVAEALKRQSSLLMMRSHIGDKPVWVCLYPPGDATAASVKDWTQKSGLQPTDGDLFIDRSAVHRAASDLGLT